MPHSLELSAAIDDHLTRDNVHWIKGEDEDGAVFVGVSLDRWNALIADHQADMTAATRDVRDMADGQSGESIEQDGKRWRLLR